ncbi:flagellar assembly protein FliW [Brevibacillus brevis]|uniref:flagellar assembly protein FliW n=1 Tax=Brevibacillus brevis TaxID=1393 RepID=UPI0025A60D54|nr:flagellar assembly protein FliW [Brevibacillus brevis]WJQ81125.1 flagellar assembly protein FliW [Brevibacillus brevis]
MASEQKIEIGKFFFEEGILGFEHLQFFHLVKEENESPFYLLQSLEDNQISFWVVDPFYFFPEYEFTLHSQAKMALHIEENHSILVVNIVTIRGENNITVNLKAPIVVNQGNRMAKQVILNEENYDVRQPLFQKQLEKSR